MTNFPSTSVEAPRPVFKICTFAPGNGSPVWESRTKPSTVPLEAARPEAASSKQRRDITRERRSIQLDMAFSLARKGLPERSVKDNPDPVSH
jgi:hypothetical protein